MCLCLFALRALGDVGPACRTLSTNWLTPDQLDQPLAERIAAFRARSGHEAFKKEIDVFKQSRRLVVFADGQELKSYVVNLGGDPVSPKAREGDSATPEGTLFVCVKNRQSQFHRFLGLAYPTPEVAQRGVREGLATAGELAATREAYRTRSKCPPQTTRLGGAVGIHGSGGYGWSGKQVRIQDWTLGCIGLRDRDIDELFDGYAEVGTTVRIFDREPGPPKTLDP